MNTKESSRENMEDLDFRDLLENANDIVQSVAPDGGFVYVNRAWCETLGYTKEEARGMKFFDILDEECHGHCMSIFARVLQGEQVESIETTFRTKDGSRIVVEGNCNCVFRDGKPYRTRGIFRNITARKQLEEKLLQAQKLESLGIMAGGIAHEYNNILMGILGFSELILQKPDIDPVVRRYVENIDRSAKRAARLTNQILSYAGQGHFHKELLDIANMIINLEKVLLASLNKNITLRIEFDDAGLPPVKGDEILLRELIIQLVSNAAESMEGNARGVVTISIGTAYMEKDELAAPGFDHDLPAGNYVLIHVRDNGVGMDREQQRRVFDPFYTTKFQGRGLGLATVHGIIRMHGGVIKITSRPGEGSCFTVLLPAEETASEISGISDRPAAKSIARKGRKATVLVIDDELVVREVNRIILEESGYDVMLAENGEEGLSILQEHRDDVDLVILDMVMPGMDGVETFRNILMLRPDLPVLMASGYGEDEIMTRLGGNDIMVDFIHKPYNEKQLQEKVADILVKLEQPA